MGKLVFVYLRVLNDCLIGFVERSIWIDDFEIFLEVCCGGFVVMDSLMVKKFKNFNSVFVNLGVRLLVINCIDLIVDRSCKIRESSLIRDFLELVIDVLGYSFEVIFDIVDFCVII